jgi:hypothetical protein
MTIRLKVENLTQLEDPNTPGYNLRVHRVVFSPDSTLAEDPVIIKPGESSEFTIWNNVRLAIEEEYEVVLNPVYVPDDQC